MYKYKNEPHLDGVMGVRSLPMVLITLRPSTQSPVQMPTPPNRSSQMGVGKLDTTDPLLYSSQMATSGPIALLEAKKAHQNLEYIYIYSNVTKPLLPDIISSVSKGAETRCEDLQELEEHGNGWMVHFQFVYLRTEGGVSVLCRVLLCTFCHCQAVAAVAVHS